MLVKGIDYLTDSPHIGKFLNALKCFLTVEEFQKDFGFAEFFVGYRLAVHYTKVMAYESDGLGPPPLCRKKSFPYKIRVETVLSL